MTSESRVFKNEFDDQWYYWAESWEVVHGPFDDYIKAHAAMSKHVEEAREASQSRC
jgi:hypothetical protein